MTQYSLQELLEEYAFQRNHNVGKDQALNLLYDLEPNLAPTDKDSLLQMVQKWEQLNSVPENDTSQQTQQVRPIDDMSKPPPRRDAPKLRPVSVEGIKCQSCDAVNPSEAKYCYACGHLLTVSVPTSTRRLEDDIDDPATFGNLSTLVVIVQGYEARPIRVQLNDQYAVIGRSEVGASKSPEIDLAPYGGKDMGVSRLHAILQRKEQTLTLTDQGSLNHTFINGEKIHPHEVRVIREGDEIRFGKLSTRFTFQRELRRL